MDHIISSMPDPHIMDLSLDDDPISVDVVAAQSEPAQLNVSTFQDVVTVVTLPATPTPGVLMTPNEDVDPPSVLTTSER